MKEGVVSFVSSVGRSTLRGERSTVIIELGRGVEFLESGIYQSLWLECNKVKKIERCIIMTIIIV